MASNWAIATLADIGTVIGGATPSTKNVSYWDGEIPWISPKDLAGYKSRYIAHGERNITAEGLSSCSTVLLPKGTILFSSRAPIGYIAIASQPMCTNQGFKSVVPGDNIDPLFLYYLLLFNRANIESQGSGTTFKEVSGSVMRQVVVRYPEDIGEQRAIASILDSIDSKIEVNQKSNDYLLELCAARYDEARRESVDGSESRFEPGVLTDLIEVNYGKDHKHLADGPYPVYGSGGLMRHVEKYLYDGESALIPRKGTLNNVMLVDGRFWTVDTMFFTKELSIGAARYAYFILKRLDLASMNAGSAVPSMTTKILSAIPVSIPDDDLLQELKEWTDPLFAQIRLNERENEQLEAMRDALLPKLMSGEIDVSGVELPTQPNNHLRFA